MVPTVHIHSEGIEVAVDGDEPVEVSVSELAETLTDIRRLHSVNGNWILVADSRIQLEEIVHTMDAARSADFHYVTVAGGAR